MSAEIAMAYAFGVMRLRELGGRERTGGMYTYLPKYHSRRAIDWNIVVRVVGRIFMCELPYC